MRPKVPCVILLPCTERIQKISKALALDQAVLITSDWLNGRHRVSQQRMYTQGTREKREEATPTAGRLEAT